MKSLSVALTAHYAQEVTTLATCWKLTRTDGQVFGFTGADVSFPVDGITYHAASGITPSSIKSGSDLSVDNLEILGVLESDLITEQDVMAGLWNNAVFEVFECNYLDPSMGINPIRTGTTGEIKLGRQQYQAEGRGMMQKLQQPIGLASLPTCGAGLGDGRCQVDLVPYTVTGTLTGVTSSRQFTDSSRTEEQHWFAGGELLWLTGANVGLSMEVKTFNAGTFTLYLPMPYEVQVGDEYSVYAGCDKRDVTCINKFGNIINFRGQPHKPGPDQAGKIGGMT